METIVSLRINSQNRVIDIVENFPSIMKQLRDMAQKAPEIENTEEISIRRDRGSLVTDVT